MKFSAPLRMSVNCSLACACRGTRAPRARRMRATVECSPLSICRVIVLLNFSVSIFSHDVCRMVPPQGHGDSWPGASCRRTAHRPPQTPCRQCREIWLLGRCGSTKIPETLLGGEWMTVVPNLAGKWRAGYLLTGMALAAWGLFGAVAARSRIAWLVGGGTLIVEGLIGF